MVHSTVHAAMLFLVASLILCSSMAALGLGWRHLELLLSHARARSRIKIIGLDRLVIVLIV